LTNTHNIKYDNGSELPVSF